MPLAPPARLAGTAWLAEDVDGKGVVDRAQSTIEFIDDKAGKPVGQWRDSNEGIGRGRYPYDVNAVWMPASLRAIGGFLDAPG